MQINLAVRTQKKSKAEIIRMALEKGMAHLARQDVNSVQSLLDLVEIGKHAHFHGPKDSSTRIDELLWSKDWSRDE